MRFGSKTVLFSKNTSMFLFFHLKQETDLEFLILAIEDTLENVMESVKCEVDSDTVGTRRDRFRGDRWQSCLTGL